ncbi:glycosyltransferase family 4 protein [Pedobacter duraquae]|uniref:Glycosyltransferase involved in cell wall biosynthesis n=1 Tax=Pedobacter duraquae TaxID=425511 RepID=A0A4V3C3D4_9SPHI|nr:glycosyltransferase family 1 protein [Pedobacter duraquae]TDO21648.1 glycosyltransferase involved in cell wall biosynthesis [Pedobacter duraquae]
MKRIKVAFFAEILVEDFDGASRTMFQLINRIDPEIFEFLFICGLGPGLLRGFECFRIPSVTLPLNTTYKMAVPFLVQQELREKLNHFAPDIVHIATPSWLGNFALKHAKQAQVPVISIYHTHFISYIDYYFKYTPFLIEPVKQRLAESQQVFYNQCDVVYVPSQSICGELLQMGIAQRRMKIWKRGIDAALFSPAKRDPGLMRELTGNNHPTLLFASRLVWEKNLETLFRIYDLIQKQNIKCNFVIAGEGIARKACELRMKSAIFTGKVSHEKLSVLYASSDIFVFPSVSETCGNVVLEAMASGLPCIIADGGGSKDFIKQGFNGFTCSPYQEQDYVNKISLLLESNRLAHQFSNNGLEHSRGFCWNRLAATYFQELQELSKIDAMVLA